MNASTRFTIVATCCLLCVGGMIISNWSNDGSPNNATAHHVPERFDYIAGYRYAAGEPSEDDLRQIEAAVLLNDIVKPGSVRVEFGSVRLNGKSALVPVLYFSRDARVLRLLYRLVFEKQSWKIVSVERVGIVRRPHLLRDLRA
jgi:hypothetical protein